MPVVPINQILDAAFAERYGVAAINIVDDLSLDAVLDAATELESPLIVQTSVKTVKAIGAGPLYSMWRARADEVPVPVSLHLDHCPEREWITTCLEAGWNSVLFDGSELDVDENTRQTVEVVAEAERHGAHVEGEIERVPGSRTGSAPTMPAGFTRSRCRRSSSRRPACTRSPRRSAPRTACTRARPSSSPSASPSWWQLHPIPMVLHGGTGLTESQFTDLISRGCAKVNISTALKIAFVESHREYLEANPGKHDPPSMLSHVREAVKDMALRHIGMFGSAGRARAVRGTTC